jgi:hypothetical protein
VRTPYWTADEDRLLGTMPDRAVTARLGFSRRTIAKRRRELQIAPYQPPGRPWTGAEEELLGTMPDRKLARRLIRSVVSVKWRRSVRHLPVFSPKIHRWTPADDKLLSERPDEQVAMLQRGDAGTLISLFLHRGGHREAGGCGRTGSSDQEWADHPSRFYRVRAQ